MRGGLSSGIHLSAALQRRQWRTVCQSRSLRPHPLFQEPSMVDAKSDVMRSETAHGDTVYESSKVPPVTLAFWIVKIFATTVGETGGDALSMTLNHGYAVSTAIFLAFFLVTVSIQIGSKRYHP